MALIAPGIARYSIEHTYLGRPAVNILDVDLTATTSAPSSRALAVREVGELIVDLWTTTIMQILNTGVSFRQVSYVDLNTEDGSTGTITGTVATPLPQGGAVSGEGISANTSILVTKQGLSARGQRNGRWFLPGIVEGNITGNTLAGSFMTTVIGWCDQFLAEFNEATGTFTTSQSAVILHTKNTGTKEDPIIIVTGSSPIRELTPNSQVASQRRRNRP